MAEIAKKYLKVLGNETGFIDNANSMNTDDLKKLILKCEGDLNEVEQAKEADTKLADAKETVKEFAAPYTETKKLLTSKIKYAVYLLEERGVDLSH
jgi:hypothetical protein